MGWTAAVGQRGQTIIPPPPPGGGGESYGPTDGRSTVIAEAAPRSVSAPPGAITFSSAADLQTRIDANSASSNFVPSAGWSDWDRRVTPGTKDPRIWIPGAPGSRTFDAGGRALFCMLGGGSAQGRMELHGGTWRNVGNTTNGGHGIEAPINSIIHDVILEDNYNAGLKIRNSGVEVGYFIARDNGQDGIGGSGDDNTWIHHGELHGNGHRDPDAAPDHGGSGKFTSGSNNIIIERVYLHEQWDYGFWSDFGDHMTFRESVAEDCRKAGIFFEMMTQGGLISRNWLARNGEVVTGGEWFFSNVMTIAACETVAGKESRVEFNHIEGAERLIAINNQTGRPGTKRVKVFDNRIKFTNSAARVGGQDSLPSGSRVMYLETPSNGGTFEFGRNLYQGVGFLPDNNFRFPLSSTNDGTDMNWTTWRGLGFDTTSTREQVSS